MGRVGGRDDLQVDKGQLLHELGGPGEYRTSEDQHRVAVEHQIVLAADQVDVGERRADLRRPTARSARSAPRPCPARTAKHWVRRSSRTWPDSAVTGPPVLPEVLADHHADVDAAPPDDTVSVAGHELPLLVEHAVVGQVVLVIAGDHRSGVGSPPPSPWRRRCAGPPRRKAPRRCIRPPRARRHSRGRPIRLPARPVGAGTPAGTRAAAPGPRSDTRSATSPGTPQRRRRPPPPAPPSPGSVRRSRRGRRRTG